jgi:diguanylate cyclase (GGDEF)-like protein
MVDLDKFKYINDTLGHQVGDRVLVETASRLHKNMRESDMVSRFGGDEFVMVLSFGKNEWQAITKVLERTMGALNKPILDEGKELSLTASFGVSVYPDDGNLPKILMMRADEAMYHAKELGRNACVFWKRSKRFDIVKFDS